MTNEQKIYDVVLIGGGIMSATLGSLLAKLEPGWSIELIERQDEPATESSNAWNNAGTGHAALCELNYTPERNGVIEVEKAIQINEQFQLSRQFWTSLVASGDLSSPGEFISPCPHMTFVRGAANVDYLRRRYERLKDEPLFRGMEYSEDPARIAEWAPLLMAGREPGEKVAATRAADGTDVNFGALTRKLVQNLVDRGASLRLGTEAVGLRQQRDGVWQIATKTVTPQGRPRMGVTRARFVFVGAGGYALPLLQSSGIPEIRGYGGFPISGEFYRTDNPEIVAKHNAKVYGKASVGAPPMSVPHLDTRVVDGGTALLFGPYAGWTPKFLKRGSLLDLFLSLRGHNLWPMLAVARDNFSLVKYLIGQLLAGQKKKFAQLQEFFPEAKPEDWRLITAGQRVQVMKRDPERGGVLQMGTEVVAAADGTIAGLLGASPGASVAVDVMLQLLARCFPDKHEAWKFKLAELVPGYGTKANSSREAAEATLDETAAALGLRR